ncbi:MAG TPA: tripartite tricarboxylate transporter substrate binding protein [Burkholderiales bacterium]|nr:tripartite tricarboxylate transporter substrate binding protein [Burkholderiales bacterium]
MHRLAKSSVGAALILSAGTWVSGPAHAQAYPSKPIRMVIALAPGGGVDTTGRLVAQTISQQFGQPVVPENRPGAGGSIATDIVAHAAPDGYTLLANSSGIVITPSLMKLGYDPRKDIQPVTQVFISPGVMVVHPSVPAKNVKELIAFARARPNQLLYSSSGQGSAQHLAMAWFCQLENLKMEHVAYKGTSPSVTDVVAGRISVTVASVISTRPFFTSGRLRALATLGLKRTPALPEYPTISEATGLKDFGVDQWYGIFAPGGTSKEIVHKLQEAIAKTVLESETRKRLLGQGLDAVATSPEEVTALYNKEMDRWAKVIKSIGLQPN